MSYRASFQKGTLRDEDTMEPEPRRTWITERLMALCAVDTTSGREDAGLPSLRAILEDLGAVIHEQPVTPGRTNVLATWGEPRVAFSTHLDTVPPYLPPVLEDGILRGRGTCDAKGQIVAQLAALRELRASGMNGFAWLGVVGEETDSIGAAAALDLADRFRACRTLVCGEPTDLQLAAGQRGVQHFRLVCRGRAAHSSTPEEGASAIWPLLDWLQHLRTLNLPEDPVLGSEIWNLGLLQGGQTPNAVPDHAEAHVHARVLPGSPLEAELRASCPPSGRVECLLDEPWDRYPRIPGFPQTAMPFGSDAPRLRALVPDGTVVLAGPGSIRTAHGPEEHITLDELDAGVDLNLRLARHFLEGPPKAKP